MDPTAAYKAMWESFRSGEYVEALEYARSIIEWADRGGFKPMGIPNFYAETICVMNQCVSELRRQGGDTCDIG